jgi:hypothetical protein
MPKVKNPLFSEEAHGALGGIEFRHNRYGNVVGRKSLAAYHSTPLQTITRSRLRSANAAFDALPPSTKHAWDLISPRPSTGRNLFIGRYLRASLIEPVTVPVPLAIDITRLDFTPTLAAFIRPALRFLVSFPVQLPPPDTLIFYYYSTMPAPRPPPHRAKFTWSAYSSGNAPNWMVLPFWPHYLWARFDEVSRYTAAVINSAHYFIELPE